jgi:Fur family transcriptional regulator, ferric uptake regulator
MRRSPEKYLRLFNRYLKTQGLRLTHQRDTIVQVFLKCPGHVDLDDLYLQVMQIDRRIGQSTLYRTMKLLVSSGLAHAHHFSDAPTRYEVAVEGQHHDHLICTSCGKILEFENPTIEKLQDEVAESFGFKIHTHRMELYGTCRECAAKGE